MPMLRETMQTGILYTTIDPAFLILISALKMGTDICEERDMHAHKHAICIFSLVYLTQEIFTSTQRSGIHTYFKIMCHGNRVK
jgi:hypothetical protein